MTVNLSALAGAGQQFFDNSGNPLTGGKLYSYAAGTTTPQATYTSASGATAHSNPIILDSAGRIATGEIWLTAGSNYKFVLQTSTSTLLATWDNITGINGTGITSNAVNVVYDPAGTGAVATTVQAKLRQTVSVMDFGAIGNGVADDTAAVQAAITASRSVYFPAGTYLISSEITVPTTTAIFGNNKVNTIIKANTVGQKIFSVSPTNYNVKFSNITIDGNSKATQGISSIATVDGQSAHMVLDNIEVSNCTDKNIYLKFMAYGLLQNTYSSNVAANSSATCLYMESCANCEIYAGLYYNGKAGSITLLKTNNSVFLGMRLYNDSSVSSAQLLLVNSSYSNVFDGCSFEPQGAANVTNNVKLQGGGGKSCTDNTFKDCHFIGVPGTSTNIISVDAYKTIIDGCKFIAQTGASILLGSQQYSYINNCCDLVTYDTPVYSIVTVDNAGGNPYVLQEQTLPVTAAFFPIFTGTATSPTVSVYGGISRYTKTTSRIYFDVALTATTVTSGGTGGLKITLTGLPNSYGSTAIKCTVSVGQHNLAISAGHVITGLINAGDNSIFFADMNGPSTGAVNANLITSGSYLNVSGSYPLT